jgi:hypothetical protein
VSPIESIILSAEKSNSPRRLKCRQVPLRAVTNGFDDLRLAHSIGLLFQRTCQKKIISADNHILDQAPATFGDLLILFLAWNEFIVMAE